MQRQTYAFGFAGTEEKSGNVEFGILALRYAVVVAVADVKEDKSLQLGITAEKQGFAAVIAERNTGLDRFVQHEIFAVELHFYAQLGKEKHREQEKRTQKHFLHFDISF